MFANQLVWKFKENFISASELSHYIDILADLQVTN